MGAFSKESFEANSIYELGCYEAPNSSARLQTDEETLHAASGRRMTPRKASMSQFQDQAHCKHPEILYSKWGPIPSPLHIYSFRGPSKPRSFCKISAARTSTKTHHCSSGFLVLRLRMPQLVGGESSSGKEEVTEPNRESNKTVSCASSSLENVPIQP